MFNRYFFCNFAPVSERKSCKMANKILFINQEISPYTTDTPMSILGKNLPQSMQENGYEIRTFMPKWSNINERRYQLHPVQRLSGMNLIIDDTDHPLIIKVASMPVSRITVYFIDSDDYFLKRDQVEFDTDEGYPDNGERAIFFARGVLETVKKLRWAPDVIHCQGWISAVIPLYIKSAYQDEPSFANTKVVTTLFEKQLDKDFGSKFKQCLEFRDVKKELLDSYNDEFDFIELGKLAIDYSDGIIVGGEEVNRELLSHAEQRHIPILTYSQDDEATTSYKTFYEQFIAK